MHKIASAIVALFMLFTLTGLPVSAAAETSAPAPRTKCHKDLDHDLQQWKNGRVRVAITIKGAQCHKITGRKWFRWDKVKFQLAISSATICTRSSQHPGWFRFVKYTPVIMHAASSDDLVIFPSHGPRQLCARAASHGLTTSRLYNLKREGVPAGQRRLHWAVNGPTWDANARGRCGLSATQCGGGGLWLTEKHLSGRVGR